MTAESKIAKAASLLLHSPPGEVDDVFNDIRGIVGDDDALQEHIGAVLAESNMQEFLVVQVPSKEESRVLLTPYNRVGDSSRFVDPNTHTSFEFDHLHRTAAEPQEHEASTEEQANEELRAAIQQELNSYVDAHYAEGTACVFWHEGTVVSCIVSNRFSPENFWNGSWRAVWSFDPASGQLNGSAKVKVHYFEDGNVQLDTQSDFAADISSQASPKETATKVAKLVREYEADFQQSIADGYRQLSEKTFKGLRRALPVTRNKIDWEKIANYRLGGELASAEN
ncbi:F-actin-capping protein subunit alpha [Coemansia sp. RSA 552]|nr:F-actin-capping protein subunit alpha [Coemansia sp. RSA 552]